MHIPPHVALSDNRGHIYRFILKSSGVDLESEEAVELLELLDQNGAQRMLKKQPIGIRYAASQRDIEKPRIWRG